MFEQYGDILTAEEACEALRLAAMPCMNYWEAGTKGLPQWQGLAYSTKGSAGICFQIFGNKLLKK